MNNSIEVYITSNYSVVLCDNDINSITESVREILYSMPRPDDYTVADLDDKQRTKLDYQYVTKKVLEQIEVIAK